MRRADVALETFPATLFDYNGVLADDEIVHLEAFRDALAPSGLSVSEHDYVQRYLGFDDRGAFRAILTDAGRSPTEQEISELVAVKKPLYLARAEARLPTFAGAAELVQRRAERGPVGVVSGALRDEIMLGLRVLGVEGSVRYVVSAEDTRACKPDPEGYLIGIERLAAEIGPALSRLALVIEDSIAGVEAAKAARLPCIAVTHSYGEAALRGAGADLVVTQLDELSDELLASLFKKLYA
jgi:beta-phosphoglucomutase-like phosphatase (HAD superfamily)